MDKFPLPVLNSNPKPSDWSYFKRQFENYLSIVKAEEEQKLPMLLNCLGRDGLDVFDGLPEPKDKYSDVLTAFDAHFRCRTSVLLRRKVFFEAKQGSNECATDFACRLRRLSNDCEFDTAQSFLLRDIFVCGIHNDRLGERLLAEESTALTFMSCV